MSTTVNNKKETIDWKKKSKGIMFDSLTGEKEREIIWTFYNLKKSINFKSLMCIIAPLKADQRYLCSHLTDESKLFFSKII